jgi:murein DD-endopeptidase MepM/ murein hydrolase activator NlpD
MPFSLPRAARSLAAATSLFFLAACQSPPRPEPIIERIQIEVTATPRPLLPAATQTASPTATITPSPTATALPLIWSGNPWPAADPEPVAQSSAPCGFVDYLDFPLAPPHADGASGGTDFGRFRSRYGKFHAGEDWGVAGWNNLGQPVYSIGHGWITYAEPLGWGPDGATVIVQHVLRSGETFYAFYGHLDPESLLFRTGECVSRGMELAAIGKPRTPAHLHFEIRYHLPWTPGPGYWETDPVAAGWLPPSATIWRSRLSAMAGVEWTADSAESAAQLMGSWNEAELLFSARDTVIARDPLTGELRWQMPLNPALDRVRLSDGLLYVADSFGTITAYTPPTDLYPDPTNETPFDPLWELNVDGSGPAELAALPAGGLLLAYDDIQFGVSAEGEVLWQSDILGQPAQMLTAVGRLFAVFPNGLLYQVDATGIHPLGRTSATLFWINDMLFSYESDGVYRIDLAGQAPPEQLAALSESFRPGEITAVPGGGFVLTHHDPGGDRLILFDSSGGKRWERSLDALPGSVLRLLTGPSSVFLLVSDTGDDAGQVKLFALDPSEPSLKLVFTAGSRAYQSRESWAVVLPDGDILIAIGGGHLVRWDPLQGLITADQG